MIVEARLTPKPYKRICGATMFSVKVFHRSHFNFLREATIWYNRDGSQVPSSEAFENVIVLSDEFYQEITSHPIFRR